MKSMPIKILGDPSLREEAKDVHEIDDEIKSLVEDMIVTMRDNNGMGLAATQVGVPINLIVLDVNDGTFDDRMPMAMINPKIIRHGSVRRVDSEGCLSVPGITAPVERSHEIDLLFTNINGDKEAHKISGMIARCVQHEVDHLNGIVYTDRLHEESINPYVKKKIDRTINGLIKRTEKRLKKEKKQ